MFRTKKEASKILLARVRPSEGDLGSYKLDEIFSNLECPFVRVVDTARSTGCPERSSWLVTPCPDVVTALYEIAEYNVIIFGKVKGSVTAFPVTGRLIQVQ